MSFVKVCEKKTRNDHKTLICHWQILNTNNYVLTKKPTSFFSKQWLTLILTLGALGGVNSIPVYNKTASIFQIWKITGRTIK